MVERSSRTRNGYTRTGLWGVIDSWIEKLLSIDRRKERAAAREREQTAARERIRRENRTAEAFDRKILERRRGA